MSKEKEVKFSKASLILREGEDGENFYFIKKGRVAIYAGYEAERVLIAVAEELQAVGELAVIDGRLRSATAVALTDIEAIQVPRHQVDQQLDQSPLWFQVIIKALAQRLRRSNDIVYRNKVNDRSLLAKMKNLAPHSDPEGSLSASAKVREVDGQSAQEHFKAGEVILREGDSGSFFYFVTKGRLGVFRDYDGKSIPLAEINEKEAIGEMSVIDGKDRSATVVALTDVSLMRITKSTFDEQLNQGRLWFQALVKTVVQRLRDVDQIFEKNDVRDEELTNILGITFHKVDEAVRVSGREFDLSDESQILMKGSPEAEDMTKTRVEGDSAGVMDEFETVVSGPNWDGGTSEALVSGDFDEFDETKITIKGKREQLTDNEKIKIRARLEKQKRIKSAANQATVLVVDSDPNFTESLEKKFEALGFRAVPCKTGDEARMRAGNQKFHSILINLHLKWGNGLSVIKQIRRQKSNPNNEVPIFVICNPNDASILGEIRTQITGAFKTPVDVDAITERLLRPN